MLESKVVDGVLVRGSTAAVPWWSFTKTVLAAAALRLVEQGRLDLDAPLEGKVYALRHLLQHTSGLPDYGGLQEYHDAVARGDTPWSVDELLGKSGAHRTSSGPGESFAYSNIGYLLVRQLIEEVTGLGINAAVKGLVFEPLDVRDARFAESADDLARSESPVRDYDPGWVYHGLIVGPLDDAVRLLDGVLGPSFLAEKTRVEMTRGRLVAETIPGRPFTHASYGLGLMIGTTEKGVMAGHTGEGPGSGIAVYSFLDLRPSPTLAAWGAEDSGTLEASVIRRAS